MPRPKKNPTVQAVVEKEQRAKFERIASTRIQSAVTALGRLEKTSNQKWLTTSKENVETWNQAMQRLHGMLNDSEATFTEISRTKATTSKKLNVFDFAKGN